ncbi:MAG: hypothetical protein RL308_2199 [Bacteroidota bacterium]|jgi:hypothetical protein
MPPKEKALEILCNYKGSFHFCFFHINEQIKLLKEMDDKWHSSLENTMTIVFEIEIEFLQIVKKELIKIKNE